MHDNLNHREFTLKTANYICERLEAVLEGTETGLPDVTPEAVRKHFEEAPINTAINEAEEEAKVDDVEMDFEKPEGEETPAGEAPAKTPKGKGGKKKAMEKVGAKVTNDLRAKQEQQAKLK